MYRMGCMLCHFTYDPDTVYIRKGMVSMENLITGQLAIFNQLYKQMDETYHQYAKKLGISDTTLWLLYSLYESDVSYTQRELCSVWHYPPQTIHSSLKSLEKQQLLRLDPVPGNRKNKKIVLTSKGEQVMQSIVSRLVMAEQNAFQALNTKDQETLLNLTKKYADSLHSEIQKLLPSSED